MEKIVLNHIIKNGNTVSYNFSFSEGLSQYFSGNPFIIEYPESVENIPDAIMSIPFVCNVLPIIWLTDSGLYLKELDKAFCDCIPNIRGGFEEMFPESNFFGKVSADKIVECDISASGGSAVFFSGGLDAVHTLVRHLDEKPALVSIWGSDIRFDNSKGWEVVHKGIADYSKKYNLPDIVIHSSFRTFDDEGMLTEAYSRQLKDNWWHGVKHGIGLLGHVAPYAYLHGLTTVYIASSNCPSDGPVRCSSNPLTDNHVRFANARVVHDGFECSRQDKVKDVVDYIKRTGDQLSLHVCWESQSGNNCCRCEKCYRTMVGLIAEGADPVGYGFSSATSTMVHIRKDLIERGMLTRLLSEIQWLHIGNRIHQNKSIVQHSTYWPLIKWILKVDFSHPEKFIGNVSIRERLSHYRFYQILHEMKISKDILYPLRRAQYNFEKKKLRRVYKNTFRKNPKTVFLLLTPEHGNLGDHAIAKAETELLTQLDVNFIEITDRKLNEMVRFDQLDVFNGFPILINGGGNLGTLWMNVETLERTIFQKNPKSRILVLPNTVFYEESDWGRNQLQKSVHIYNGHKHLTIYARERISYDFMNSIYSDVRLIPDMVLLLKRDEYSLERKGCLLCLRTDCEKTRTKQQEDVIRHQAEILFGDQVMDADMIAKNDVPAARREDALNEKLEEFAEAELVITDRLHGMIFCAITGTPCIVLDSKSPKVRGCYEWIKHLDYIRFADRPEDITAEYHAIPDGPHHYDNSHLTHYYQTLSEDIQNIWR